jgi:hypothetical protein
MSNIIVSGIKATWAHFTPRFWSRTKGAQPRCQAINFAVLFSDGTQQRSFFGSQMESAWDAAMMKYKRSYGADFEHVKLYGSQGDEMLSRLGEARYNFVISHGANPAAEVVVSSDPEYPGMGVPYITADMTWSEAVPLRKVQNATPKDGLTFVGGVLDGPLHRVWGTGNNGWRL